MAKAAQRSGAPLKGRIIDAIRDQHGDHWIRYGTGKHRSIWFSVAELQASPQEVLKRLGGTGMTFLRHASRDAFFKAIEERSEYREGIVASQPGWVEKYFVAGDGTVLRPKDDETEVLVSFDLLPKFSPVGTLKGWKASIRPIVADQPVAMFALAFAFTGPLLKIAPPYVLNPLVEIVGEPLTGKSTMNVLCASVWAGDPDAQSGGAETWDFSPSAIETLKLSHAFMTLGLDEASTAGSGQSNRDEYIRDTIFRLAGTALKRRYGDSGQTRQVRHSVLSTANKPLVEMLGKLSSVERAALSRMVTIRIGAEYGVLAKMPRAFATSRAAIEALRVAANENYGVAGPAFVARLVSSVRNDPDKAQRVIEKRMSQYLAHPETAATPARISHTFALTAVAVMLACEADVLPFDAKEMCAAIREVHRSVAQSAPASKGSPSALDRVMSYRDQHRRKLIPVSSLEAPLDAAAFNASHGFCRQTRKGTELIVPSARFQREFPDYKDLMRELRKADHAKTEGGNTPKLTIKAPNPICRTGRVYSISLPS